jgi:hypothetical protein
MGALTVGPQQIFDYQAVIDSFLPQRSVNSHQTLVSGAPGGVWGGYVPFYAVSAFKTFGIWLNAAITAVSGWEFDIALGAPGAEVTLIPEIRLFIGAGGPYTLVGMYLPFMIPAGSRISGRANDYGGGGGGTNHDVSLLLLG